MKPTREMVKQRLEALEGQATKAAVLEAWDGLEVIGNVLHERLLRVPNADYVPEIGESWAWIDLTKAKIYRALGGDA